MKRKRTKYLVIHCADTPNGSTLYGIEDVRRWHKARGFTDVGYHQVIHVDGSHHQGREDDEKGAHCWGINGVSVGICLMGKDEFTLHQWQTLAGLFLYYREKYPGIKVIGHRDKDYRIFNRKTCPGFGVGEWLAGGTSALAGHLI